MESIDRKKCLAELIAKYKEFKTKGKLDFTSEETIRTWLNDFLKIFQWDVRDTTQVLQEKVLSKEEKEKLKEIESTSDKPDYTFKRGYEKLAFFDAKDISVKIKTDRKAAFQIKSYGWSISAPCSFMSNFEELAIHDCTYVPDKNQEANFGRIYFTIDEYLEKFELIEKHFLKENIYGGVLNEMYSDTLKGVKGIEKITPDLRFAKELSDFRLLLASNILRNNKKLIKNNTELLAYIAQVIINRIIFIRVCEARSIEKDGLLLDFYKKGFWKNFKASSYGMFYKHYDGPLFERIKEVHDISITNKVFKKLLNYLYYPSPYRFDVIPTKLLSDIYEVFLAKKLIIEKGRVTDKLKLEFVKTNGAISTPQYLVRDLVKRTLFDKNLSLGGFKKVFDTKILDYACGSGSFLIEIFQYLESTLLRVFKNNPKSTYSDLFTNTDTAPLLTLEGKRFLIENCIYGVDIDPEAVEVTRMSLSLKVIDSYEYRQKYQEIGIFGQKILNNVGLNIKCGNTLIPWEITDKCPEIESQEDQLLKTNPFDWKASEGFEHIFKCRGGFDAIISNPPYVEVKNYNEEFPFVHRYIKQEYSTAINGKVDLAIPFVERGASLLNSKGKLGLVLQKRFFKTNYGKNIRSFVTTNRLLSQIMDFEANNIFRGRITYICYLIIDKAKPRNIYYHKVCGNPERLSSILLNLEAREKDSSKYFRFSYRALSHNPWNFDDPELLKISTSLLKLGTFSQAADVKVGIQVLWDKAYHIRVKKNNKNRTLTGDTHLESNIKIELGACRPLLCNERFHAFRNDDTTVYAIFPYDIKSGKNIPIAFDNFCRRFPRAGRYLRKHKDTIIKNVETWDDNKFWHQFTRVQNHTATYHRVVTPMTSNDTYGAVIKNPNLYCDNANVYFINLKDKSEKYLYATAGIINSIIFSVLARLQANPQTGGYYKFNKQFLDPIPFPNKNFEKDKKGLVAKIAGISKKIEVKQNQYLSSSPRQKSVQKRLLRNMWKALDELVYTLYGLNKNQKDFFNNKGRNVDRIEVLD